MEPIQPQRNINIDADSSDDSPIDRRAKLAINLQRSNSANPGLRKEEKKQEPKDQLMQPQVSLPNLRPASPNLGVPRNRNITSAPGPGKGGLAARRAKLNLKGLLGGESGDATQNRLDFIHKQGAQLQKDTDREKLVGFDSKYEKGELIG